MRTCISVCIGVVIAAAPARAQAPRPSARVIGRIIDAALQEVVPPTLQLTSQTVNERGIRFDFERTLAAFGLVDNARTRASLHLNRTVAEGTASVLADCDQMGTKPCTHLGATAYVYVEPISLSGTEARIRVHVLWATSSPSATYLSGSSTEVIVRRSASGPVWIARKTGRGVIS